jgi:hypothetical protein
MQPMMSLLTNATTLTDEGLVTRVLAGERTLPRTAEPTPEQTASEAAPGCDCVVGEVFRRLGTR